MTQVKELVDSLIENKITMVMSYEFDTVTNHFDKINKVEGDIVECGVWRGGFSIFLAHLFPERTIWVCDSYEGFQPVAEAKFTYSKQERHVPEYTMTGLGPMGISLDEVQNHFKTYGLENQNRIKFVKGFVKDTLPTAGIEKIALLRVDVDGYSPTLEVLDELYDKVETGGYIIFDDLCLYESKDAVVDFFNSKNLPLEVLDPITDQLVDLNHPYVNSNSGFAAGSYIIKKIIL
jgi:hypothetical protein